MSAFLRTSKIYSQQNIHRDRYVVFDFETTGLCAESDTIIEIGAVRVEKGVVVEEFSELINPQRPLSAKITEITGLQDDDLVDKRVLAEVFPDFLRFIGEDLLVAHYARFDVGFLNANIIRLAPGFSPNIALCTMVLAQNVVSRDVVGSYKLSALLDYFGLVNEKAHRALDDARATGLLFEKLKPLAVV